MPVLVEDDPVLEVAVADAGMVGVLADGARRRPAGDRGLDRVAVGLRDRGGRDPSAAPSIAPVRIGAAPAVALWATMSALAPAASAAARVCGDGSGSRALPPLTMAIQLPAAGARVVGGRRSRCRRRRACP